LPNFWRTFQYIFSHWFLTTISSTNETDCHDITEMLLKVVLNPINKTNHTIISCLNVHLLIIQLTMLVVINPTTIQSWPWQPLKWLWKTVHVHTSSTCSK
jgi:hypothetical protein